MDAWIFLFTVIASTEGFLIAIASITVLLFIYKKPRHARALLASTSVLVLGVSALKEMFKVARPPSPLIEATGYAFPSGHAAGATFLALVVIWLTRHLSPLPRYIVMALGIFTAGAISVSRITYHVHTPFQVLAGFAIAVLCIGVFIALTSHGKKNLEDEKNATS